MKLQMFCFLQTEDFSKAAVHFKTNRILLQIKRMHWFFFFTLEYISCCWRVPIHRDRISEQTFKNFGHETIQKFCFFTKSEKEKKCF